MVTYGESKKSGKSRKAPKVSKYNYDDNYFRESDTKSHRTSTMLPLKQKRLSK